MLQYLSQGCLFTQVSLQKAHGWKTCYRNWWKGWLEIARLSIANLFSSVFKEFLSLRSFNSRTSGEVGEACSEVPFLGVF